MKSYELSSCYDVLHYKDVEDSHDVKNQQSKSVVSRLAMVATRFTYNKLLKHAKLCSYMKIYEISYEVS